MNDIYSFYQLISKYHIEIPIIQRDYAQGRKDTKATDVRKSIVHNMVSAIKDGKELFFDFVFGRVDGNKFIPFDGQQRLTTLFLLHKYVFEKCQSESDCYHKDSCICKDILSRFTYSTRQSSREFCNEIVSCQIIPGDDFIESKRNEYREKCKSDNEEEDDKIVQEYIENKADWITYYIFNQSWFYPDWKKDPTIMGMLAMLDEIHNQLKKEKNFRGYAEKLTSGCSCPITFHFVDMGEHRLTDDTYVKMNARGKTLTPFENFKASLEQYLEKKQKTDLQERLNDKIDGTWLDLFWSQANKDNKEKVIPDSMMMSFVNRHFINVWSCWYSQNINKHGDEEANLQKEYDDFDERLKNEMPLYPSKDNYVPWDIYQNVIEKCGIDNCLTPIFNIWDAVSTGNKIEKDCQAVWNKCDGAERWNLYLGIKNNNTETYSSRVAFYALLRYYANETECNGDHLSQWMRVVWNIVENSTIDSSEPYKGALRLIDELSKHTHDICAFLSKNQSQIKSDFAEEQVLEEVAKAKQILDGEPRTDGKSWKEIITEAEKFFKGAIRFLFTKESIGDDWELFNTKWGNAQKYFDENGVKKEFKSNAVLLRALLSRINIGENWFGYDMNFWRKTMLSGDNRSAIHYLLTTNELVIEEACGRGWITNNDLLKTLLELECYPTWHILNNWRGFSVLTRYTQRRSDATSQKEIVVLNDLRNKLLDDDKIEINPEIKVGESTYLYGWDINFKYNKHFFRWWGNPNETEPNVYLMEEGWANRKNRPNHTNDIGTDEDKYYCFLVDAGMTKENFTNKLECLINQAEQELLSLTD